MNYSQLFPWLEWTRMGLVWILFYNYKGVYVETVMEEFAYWKAQSLGNSRNSDMAKIILEILKRLRESLEVLEYYFFKD